jgi:hypothetical protein
MFRPAALCLWQGTKQETGRGFPAVMEKRRLGTKPLIPNQIAGRNGKREVKLPPLQPSCLPIIHHE